MIYLDHGATSYPKPPQVVAALRDAAVHATSPGRGGYSTAMLGSKIVFDCRLAAAEFFHCRPEQVVFTGSCTQSLNIAIHDLVKSGDKVIISGFEHNAVTRTLKGYGAKILVAGRKLFDWYDMLVQFEEALRKGADLAIFSHVSNVFGYILPIEDMASLCRKYDVPFIVDAAQSAGKLPIDFEALGADFVAMPGHKGLLAAQGTGVLLCKKPPKPLVFGGTGSDSILQDMPVYLPDRLEAGTVNVPGIGSLLAGLNFLKKVGIETIEKGESQQVKFCARELQKRGVITFFGEHQAGTLSFVPKMDCEDFAARLADMGIAVRAGLHCAPLAHESAGTLSTGTVRVSFGYNASCYQSNRLLYCVDKILRKTEKN